METNVDTGEIKQQLSEIQRQLSEQINDEYQRIHAPLVTNPDNADRAFDYTARSRRNSLLEKMENQLTEVNKALKRIDEGTYGICSHCGKTITPDRLEILPYVELCITCQRKENARN